jgi:c-di-GMP-related signal transduction protein
MELAATYLRPADGRFAAAAFMAGIFSLAHQVFGEDLGNMANMLQLTGDIRAAIISRCGPLGLLLDLAVAAERGVAEPLCRAHAELAALSPPVIAELTLSAGSWLGARPGV